MSLLFSASFTKTVISLLDFVSPNQPDNEVMPETQDTQKRNKKKRKTNNGPPMKKLLSENATWTNPRIKPKVIRKNAKIFGKKSSLLGTI
ncbi:hypothetical protein R6Q57_020798 [Mikania cordata]